MNILRIVQGHWNKLLSRNAELKDFRIKNGCEKCILYRKDKVGWCSSKKDGGCNCDMGAKATLHDAKCPQLIWYNDAINIEKLEEVNTKYTDNE